MDTTQANPSPVYAGSFAPITLGHLGVIAKGVKSFGEITVAVGKNPGKSVNLALSQDQRVELVRRSIEWLATQPGQPSDLVSRVHVTQFDGSLVSFMKETGSRVIIRGVRSNTDLEDELGRQRANELLARHDYGFEIVTALFLTDDELSSVSSSVARELMSPVVMASVKTLSSWLAPPVAEEIVRLREAGQLYR